MHRPRVDHRPNDVLVDESGVLASFPMDLVLRWLYQDPDMGGSKVIYARDTELQWTEIVVGARSGIVPGRYVEELSDNGMRRGPMTRQWFLDMVSQFEVTAEGSLLRDGLEVCREAEDFEWKVFAVLPADLGDIDFALYTPERLVHLVRQHTGLWHLDSFNRAQAILHHFNTVSPLPRNSSTPPGLDLYSRYRFLPHESIVSPPHHASIISLPDNWQSIHVVNVLVPGSDQYAQTYIHSSSSPMPSFPSSPISTPSTSPSMPPLFPISDSDMNFEDEI
ncbi:hypothetical protein GYMLUDRAFT_65132 [Collybiopsis luxurians FD-317 M1]|uniref:Uncharacterized protein n=1 Tax=Collybiopsis luxurians FD-317 M1 TaxID=944289 RepID=A0A0D0BMU0_9AGAR|nr:hypothetical protein GYMLUDRAFT_65132 [Collybiopsis luxurians FD-317 M1]